MKVILDVELIEDKNGSVKIKLKTGFGDPIIIVHNDYVQFVAPAGA